MKKKIGKTILIICICALLIFLLLPFLETQSPSAAEAKKAQPQIFTSNPLTALVNRIASFFQGKQKRLEKEAAQAKAQAKAAQDALEELYADVPPSARYSAEKALQEGQISSSRFDYGDAAMQDADGNWVLVRQTAPEAGRPGIHEINSTDNAYDRYVRQEQAARLTPGLNKPSQQEESALARIFTPIKNWLGFNKTSSVQPGEQMLRQQPQESVNTGAFSAKGAPTTAGSRASAASPALENFAVPSRSGNTGNFGSMNFGPSSISSAADLLDPMQTISRAAKWVEENQPATATEEEKESKRENLKQIILSSRERLYNMLGQQLQQTAGDAPASDLLPTTIGCKGESGSFYNTNTANCSNTESVAQNPSAWMSPDELEKQQQAGKAQLVEKLNLPPGHPSLPDVNLLVVLGKTNSVRPPDMQEQAEGTDSQQAAKEATSKIYELMLEQQQCTQQECYWIPNKVQQYPQVREAVETAGFVSVEDPLDLYAAWVLKLEEALLNETQDDPTGERYMQLQKALSTNAPAYIPVTRKQIEELNRRNDDRNLINPEKRSQHIVFYVPDPQNARDVQDVFQEHPAFFVWGKDNRVFDLSSQLDTPARAGILQDDITQRAQEMALFAQGVVQELYRDNVKDAAKRQAGSILKMDEKQAQQSLEKQINTPPDLNQKTEQSPAQNPNKITPLKLQTLQL